MKKKLKHKYLIFIKASLRKFVLFSLFLLSLMSLFYDLIAEARNFQSNHYRNRYGKCSNTSANRVSSTSYFVPHRNNYKTRAAFVRDVKMQGTGTLSNGTVLRYNGKTQKLPKGCNTAVGASGHCLLPFFSIAADAIRGNHRRKGSYKMGDVIFIPELQGKMVTLPNGTTITHPGLFVVDDVGSDIKGKNRFDFFTGNMSPNNKKNVFGYYGELGMSDRNSCNKTFSVLNNGKVKEKFLALVKEARKGIGNYNFNNLSIDNAKLLRKTITPTYESAIGSI